jgi:hypothetical protein
MLSMYTISVFVIEKYIVYSCVYVVFECSTVSIVLTIFRGCGMAMLQTVRFSYNRKLMCDVLSRCGCWSMHQSATKALTHSIIWFVLTSIFNSVVLLFWLGCLMPSWYSVLCITHLSLNLLLHFFIFIPHFFGVCIGTPHTLPKIQLHSCGWLTHLTFGKCTVIYVRSPNLRLWNKNAVLNCTTLVSKQISFVSDE